MALHILKTSANGVNTLYHRIQRFQCLVNQCNVLEILHYADETYRDEERSGGLNNNAYISSETLTIPYDPTMSVVTAYKYLKTLSEYADATDVLEYGQTGEPIDITPTWEANKQYLVGQQCLYERSMYTCIQAHISQEDWTPPVVPALFVLVHEYSDPTVIPEWLQPTGSHDAYYIGDKVRHNDKVWISIADNNVWEPGVYGWDEFVTEETFSEELTEETNRETSNESTTIENQNGSEVVEEGPAEWIQPVGASDAYNVDDVVAHNGYIWISVVSGNVWEPGVYGWNELSE